MNSEPATPTVESMPMPRPVGQADPPPSVLASIRAVGISSIRDTLSSYSHSKDFAYARGDYLRSRVLVVGIIFALLTPLWIAIDTLMLPPSTLAYTTPGRFFLMAGLIATIVIAHRSRSRVTPIRLSAGLLIALPAAFYALVLLTLPPNETNYLAGYSFIPFLLVATLSIFPFTLAESALAGLTLLGLHVFSQHLANTWMTPAGWEQIWLLAALLTISLTANYFHLGLLLRLYREATHDSLTGLLNRGAIAHHLQRLQAAHPSTSMSLLMLDMDHFKKINDTHGHSVGDQVLRKFAAILRQHAQASDFIARYGGEEFVMVLPGKHKQQAMDIAENIRHQTEKAHIYNHDGIPVPFTVSIGVAGFRATETFDEAARRADDRLYQAKKRQRNCVVGV